MNPQLKKGILELCVLSVLKKKETYGYEIVATISKEITISEGTIYPMLKRFLADELVESYLKESNEGPSRKYYKLTPKGMDYFQSSLGDWENIVQGVQIILNKEEV